MNKGLCRCGCGRETPLKKNGEHFVCISGHASRLPTPTIEDLMARSTLDPVTGCWNWAGSIGIRGYGQITVHRVNHQAHRYAYALVHGEIPDGSLARHKCDNRPCCNPAHIELGTHVDNMEDKAARGRALQGVRHHSSKVSDDDVVEILMSDKPTKHFVEKFGMSKEAVNNLRKGKTWKPVFAQVLAIYCLSVYQIMKPRFMLAL